MSPPTESPLTTWLRRRLIRPRLSREEELARAFEDLARTSDNPNMLQEVADSLRTQRPFSRRG